MLNQKKNINLAAAPIPAFHMYVPFYLIFFWAKKIQSGHKEPKKKRKRIEVLY
jgi:hypothetical protein